MGSQGLKFRNLLFFSHEMKFKLKHGSDLLTLLSKTKTNEQTALKDHLSHLCVHSYFRSGNDSVPPKGAGVALTQVASKEDPAK